MDLAKSNILFFFVYAGTTVSATSYAAHRAGIRIFATGGIGGVHIGGEKSFDISSDLTSLATTPVAVVSAGVKSILDIRRTLEVLETNGVCVSSVGTDEFPAFFTRNSGLRSPGRVNTPDEAAQLLSICLGLRPTSGLLFAVPIPQEMQAVADPITRAIATAFQEAEAAKITGASVTPFLLERVRFLTGDISLQANIHLVMNNAKFAAQMASSLSKLENSSFFGSPQIAVVGGSNLDTLIKMQPPQLKTTNDIIPPSSFPGTVEIAGGGGVGRNIADCISRLSVPHVFLTAVAEDNTGRNLIESYPKIAWDLVPELPTSTRTANYIGVLNSTGDLLFGVADMDIHKRVSPSFVNKELERLMKDPNSQIKVICTDANVIIETIQQVIATADKFAIPVWYEPTDLHKCTKILEATNKPIAVISPNQTELEAIYEKVTAKEKHFDAASRNGRREIVETIRSSLFGVSNNWLVKIGQYGLMFINANEAFHLTSPVTDQKSIISVSGAGDSCAATVLYLRYVRGWSWKQSTIGGLKAAELSLSCKDAVPTKLNQKYFIKAQEIEDWSTKIKIEIF